MQPYLFKVSEPSTASETMPDFGTFKDSLRAPVHNWFRYPAGYSYKFVEYVFAQAQAYLVAGGWVYDPFSGSGTTLLCAQQAGFNAYGVEAHSFVHWVAEVKLRRDYKWDCLGRDLGDLLRDAQVALNAKASLAIPEGTFPELVYKCYHPRDLQELYVLREFVAGIPDIHLRDLLKLALTEVLRSAAAAGTGWPYIAPRKNKGDKPPKGAGVLFERTVWKMYRDLQSLPFSPSNVTIRNVLGDSRQRQALEDGQIDVALTSPPYLNNFDYADRTRLETYFWGITHSWRDISRQFRDRLIVAATTQIVRSQHQIETVLDTAIRDVDPAVYQIIQDAVIQLGRVRLTKGGKKDYDLMVALYFNDILAVLGEAKRVIHPGGSFYLVLGDSAPYGIHVPTDELIGRLGTALGFQDFKYYVFRTRGDKWKNNPQRHNIALREGVVILNR